MGSLRKLCKSAQNVRLKTLARPGCVYSREELLQFRAMTKTAVNQLAISSITLQARPEVQHMNKTISSPKTHQPDSSGGHQLPSQPEMKCGRRTSWEVPLLVEAQTVDGQFNHDSIKVVQDQVSCAHDIVKKCPINFPEEKMG